MKRKLEFLFPFEGFFELHSWATEGKKDKKWKQKGNFLAILKWLNEFNIN